MSRNKAIVSAIAIAAAYFIGSIAVAPQAMAEISCDDPKIADRLPKLPGDARRSGYRLRAISGRAFSGPGNQWKITGRIRSSTSTVSGLRSQRRRRVRGKSAGRAPYPGSLAVPCPATHAQRHLISGMSSS